VTYLRELAAALAEVGIQGRRRRRIVTELEDHIACDPEAAQRLGEPRELAAAFAAELATVGTRRAVVRTFIALVGVAVTFLVPLVALDWAVGYPDLFAGRSTALSVAAGVVMLVAPQVAFVAGVLAAVRAVRRRRDVVLPAAEVRLLQRRAGIAAGSGAVSVLGVALYAVNFTGELPAWWIALALSCSAAGLALAGAAGVVVATIAGVRSAAGGPAGGLDQDLPWILVERLAARPLLLCAAVGVPVCLAALVLGWLAEGALVDGLVRAAPEALAFLAGFAALGRPLGVRD
jgi:hypothetical protein